MRKIAFLMGVALAGSLSLGAATPFVKLPSPTYAGLVRDYMRVPYDSTNYVGVIVRRATDDKLLASTMTGNVTDGINYSLSVPMVSASSDVVTGLTYGEKVTFSFAETDVLWSNFETVTVDRPGYVRKDFTICHDENGNGVADEYEDYIAIKMADYGIVGEYDPDADYNGDGITNRDHYLAGTNPFVGMVVNGETVDDGKCTISSMMNVRSEVGDDYFAITFNAADEWIYSVVAIDDLSVGWGCAETVVTSESAGGDLIDEYHHRDSPGEMTLYIPKGDAKQRFFKLSIESW